VGSEISQRKKTGPKTRKPQQVSNLDLGAVGTHVEYMGRRGGR
jgi:hypothetical protein